eukprot:15453337-Alexandrium_andersonii.AAC.1
MPWQRGVRLLPLELETEAEAELMPLRKGTRPMKPEFEGYAKAQVAIDSGTAASAMPEKLPAGHAVPGG